ncbi:diguanylate cyclase [Helicobacter sp. MIT 11-5569]|uniref:diguanylate cyclase domain-containing protein n=1 Tax=Helicobacter sp. MIT 11-5569 TaxID=1548151 RepID=UPI00051FD235|nr:diguanylate cyclase [Helicobacter sp. MIT 11-5569]TLD85243.1 diguanylate cyclase [Helicobacter sp. MIT 11-5569]
MQNAQNIAREALRELLKEGKDPTPDAYAQAYCAAAKKLGVVVEMEFSIEKVLEMLESEVKESLSNKKFKNKNEFFIALTKAINHLNFSKKNFSTSLETLKLLLRLLATYPQKEVSTFAKGHLIEIDKLNSKSMQIWRERWVEQVKKIPEIDILDSLKIIEILSNFKIPHSAFQKWQDEARNLLKGSKPSKDNQVKLLKSLESQILALCAKSAESPQNPQTSQNQQTLSNAQTPKQQDFIKPPETPKKPSQYKDVMALPIDAVTTLVSKVGMQEVLHFAEEEFLKNKENYSVIVFGIAEYDKIKEHFGLEAAKRILATLGRLLKQYSNARDLIAYYGDEEFLACLLGREKEEAIAFIYNLDKIVNQSKFMFQQTRITISLSAQVSHRMEAKDLESMLKMSIEEFIKHKDSQGIIKYDA